MGLNIQRNVQGVEGLHYCPNYLSPSEQDSLLSQVDASVWLSDMERRVQHYGHRYDYKSRSVKKLGPLPKWLAVLSTRLVKDQLSPRPFNQVIVNEYLLDQGIGRHTDAPVFGETIVSLSLGAQRQMDFSGPGSGPRGRPIQLEAGSAVILSGPARTQWKHGIAPKQSDSPNAGIERRVSLTFRWVILETAK